MFKSVRRAVVQGVEKTWNTFASSGEGRGTREWDGETNRYKREIMIAAKDLDATNEPDAMVEAIKKIGQLAYAGGPDAGKCAGNYLEVLLNYLVDRSTVLSVKTQIMRSLSMIYRGHRDHGERFRNLGVITVIADIMRASNEPKLLRWCCYTLFTVCAGSLRNVSLVEVHDLQSTMAVLAKLTWKGWPMNYGQALMLIVGYAKEKDFEEQGEGTDDIDKRESPMSLKFFKKVRQAAEIGTTKKTSIVPT